MDESRLREFREALDMIAEVVSAAVVAKFSPPKDLLTRAELYSEFGHLGKAWLDTQLAPVGPIVGKRFGSTKRSPVLYSRSDLLKAFNAQRLFELEITGKYSFDRLTANPQTPTEP